MVARWVRSRKRQEVIAKMGRGFFMDIQNDEMQKETMALLKLLALGNTEIEQGKYSDVEDVFAEFDKELKDLLLKTAL